MEKILFRKKLLFIILLPIFICISCGEEYQKKKNYKQKRAPEKKTIVKKKSYNYSKKKLIKKTIAKPVTIVTFTDNSVMKVTDFKFYSYHVSVSGMYFKSSKNRKSGLLIEKDNIWWNIKGKDIQKIKIESKKIKKYKWKLYADIILKDKSSIAGEIPIKMSETWLTGDYFWVSGDVNIFSKKGEFKQNLNSIKTIKTDDSDKNIFLITTKKGIVKKIKNIGFGHSGTMPYSSPGICSLSGSLSIVSEGVTVKLKLKEIKKFEFLNRKIKMITKKGESGFISMKKSFTRIYGKLNSGKILFTYISPVKGIKVKSILFE